MESQPHSESESECSSSQEEKGGENPYGFEPMECPTEEAESKKRKREESEESKQLKKEILRYVSRYPQLQLRTSRQIMERLNEMDEDELKIVRDHCITDLSDIRGSPVASSVIFAVTKPIDVTFLEGYTEQCLSDIELKRDVETEIISILGDLSNRINIFFRLLNNAYITWKKNRGEYVFDAKTPIPKYATETNNLSERPSQQGETGEREKIIDYALYADPRTANSH